MELFAARSVPYGNSFLLVGGYVSTYVDTVYELDPDQLKWIELSQKLENARYWHAAFLVPNSLIECS